MPNCPYCGSSSIKTEMAFWIIMIGYKCNSCGEKFAKPSWVE